MQESETAEELLLEQAGPSCLTNAPVQLTAEVSSVQLLSDNCSTRATNYKEPGGTCRVTETQHGPNDFFQSAVKHLIHYLDTDLGKELDCILRYDGDSTGEAFKAM